MYGLVGRDAISVARNLIGPTNGREAALVQSEATLEWISDTI